METTPPLKIDEIQSRSGLYHIAVTLNGSERKIDWPCITFDDYGQLQSTLKSLGWMERKLNLDFVELVLKMKVLNKTDSVVFLIGDRIFPGSENDPIFAGRRILPFHQDRFQKDDLLEFGANALLRDDDLGSNPIFQDALLKVAELFENKGDATRMEVQGNKSTNGLNQNTPFTNVQTSTKPSTKVSNSPILEGTSETAVVEKAKAALPRVSICNEPNKSIAVSRSNRSKKIPETPTLRRVETNKPKKQTSKTNRKKETSDTESERSTIKSGPKIAYRLPSFDHVRALLEKGGYKFRENMYCLPGKDPKKDATAELGVDFFQTEQAFRDHLCIYGVCGNSSVWNEEESKRIQAWVRSNIVKSVDGDAVPDDYDVLDEKEAIKILRSEFGVRYVNRGLISGFVVPDLSTDANDTFTDKELLLHLTRYGLPRNWDFSKANPRKLLSLELFLTEPGKTLDTLKTQSPTQETESVCLSTRKRRRSIDPALDSGKMESPENTKLPEKKQLKTLSPSAKQASFPVVTRSDDTPTLSSPSFNQPLPMYQGSDKEKLECCLEALKPSSVSGNLVIPKGTKYNKNLGEIYAYLNKCVKKHVDDDEPNLLYVCGAPGTGKTSGVEWCCEKIISEMSHSGQKVVLCNISACHLASSVDPLTTMLEYIAASLGLNRQSRNAIMNRLRQESSPWLLVIVDEIDMLVNCESALTTLAGFATDPVLKATLIGISNSTGDTKYALLHESVYFNKIITFRAYSENELVHILQARVGETIFESKALDFIAKKIAQGSGDVRKALELASGAVKNCLLSLGDQVGDMDTQHALVKIPHVASAFKHVNRAVANIIDGLPTLGKTTLCVIVSLAKAEVTMTSIAILKRFVKDCVMQRETEEEMMSMPDFVAILEMLLDSGLLNLGKIDKASGGSKLSRLSAQQLAGMPIQLGIQLDDVEQALGKLLNQSYFENVRNYAVKNRDVVSVKSPI